MKIPFSLIGVPPITSSSKIGIDVAFIDNVFGTRKSKLAWFNPNYNSYQNPFYFGTVDFTTVNLPLSVLSYAANQQTDGDLLKWTTANEINIKGF